MEWYYQILVYIGVYLMGWMTGRASGVVYTLSKLGRATATAPPPPLPESARKAVDNIYARVGLKQ